MGVVVVVGVVLVMMAGEEEEALSRPCDERRWLGVWVLQTDVLRCRRLIAIVRVRVKKFERNLGYGSMRRFCFEIRKVKERRMGDERGSEVVLKKVERDRQHGEKRMKLLLF